VRIFFFFRGGTVFSLSIFISNDQISTFLPARFNSMYR